VARIKAGLEERLVLGSVDTKRDWGHARDYVEAMWRMLQHSQPDDYIVATGKLHSVKEFVEKAFQIGDSTGRAPDDR
jgi:GDPmannose 4,6-dehydratase